MIVLIFVAGEDAKHATANHLQQRMPWHTSRLGELPGKALGQPQLLIPLPEDQQAGIGGNVLINRFDTNVFFRQKIERQRPNIVYPHPNPDKPEPKRAVAVSEIVFGSVNG